uniref:Uncharacterized protein n=1 Tax=Ustilago esculenta TaxID=185366 RepID=A0A481SH22_9BASI|nr:hypothetical protein UE_1374 [Ustilago esculenta]
MGDAWDGSLISTFSGVPVKAANKHFSVFSKQHPIIKCHAVPRIKTKVEYLSGAHRQRIGIPSSAYVCRCNIAKQQPSDKCEKVVDDDGDGDDDDDDDDDRDDGDNDDDDDDDDNSGR